MRDLQFIEYYDAHYTALLNFAKRFTQDLASAEDLVQETAFKAYKSRDSFKPGTSFKSWAFTILKNTYITKYNKKKKQNVASQPIEDLVFAADKNSLAENDAISTMRVETIQASIDELSYKTRLPLLMYIEGYQYKEIADTLNIPVGTVKSRINFARTKLQSLEHIQELLAA